MGGNPRSNNFDGNNLKKAIIATTDKFPL